MKIKRHTIRVDFLDHGKIGIDVRRARMKAGLSLERMGGYMGISASMLSLLERGDRHWTDELLLKAEVALS